MSGHCDHYIDDETTPKCLREFLAFHRLPASDRNKSGTKIPTCYATLVNDAGFEWGSDEVTIKAGSRVALTMASRFGDVGITRVAKPRRQARESGYEARVFVDELKDFSEKP